MVPAILCAGRPGNQCWFHPDSITHIAERPTRKRLATRIPHPWRIVWHKHIVVVLSIHLPSQRELLEIVQTDDGLGFGFRSRKRWQQETRQYRNDREDDQRFNQCEGGGKPTPHPSEEGNPNRAISGASQTGNAASYRLHGEPHD